MEQLIICLKLHSYVTIKIKIKINLFIKYAKTYNGAKVCNILFEI